MYSYRSLDLPVRESNNGLPPAYIVSAGSPYRLSPLAAIHRSIRIRTSAGTGGNLSSSKAGGVLTEGGRTRSRAPNRIRAKAKPANVSLPVLVSSHLPMNAIECRYTLWSAKTAASGIAGNRGGSIAQRLSMGEHVLNSFLGLPHPTQRQKSLSL
jgi:hypothetical protein